MLEAAKEKYDFIFIDVSSNIFLDSTKWALQECSKILFVTEDSNIALKKTTQLFDVLFTLWNIWKNKVSIILNKVDNRLEEEVFEEVCKIKVVGKIRQNLHEQVDGYEKILEIFNYIPKKTLFEKLNSTKFIFNNFMKLRGENIKTENREDKKMLKTI